MENHQGQQQQQPSRESVRRNLFPTDDTEQLSKDLDTMEEQARKAFEARYQIIGEIKRDPVPPGQPVTPRKEPTTEWG